MLIALRIAATSAGSFVWRSRPRRLGRGHHLPAIQGRRKAPGFVEGQVIALDTECTPPPSGPLSHRRGHPVSTNVDLQAGTLPLGLFGIAAVGDQNGPPVGQQQDAVLSGKPLR